MKTIFFLNHGFESRFTLMYINLFFRVLSTGDFHIYNHFFNYNNYCFINYFFSFFIEFFLILHIIYSFLFFKINRNNFKIFFYQYIFFLIVLFLSSYINFFFSYNILITINLINNKYILFCKLLTIFLLIIILFISKNKWLLEPKNLALNEITCVFSFLILFICILFSAFDFFIIYLTIEAISLIVYTLGSLLNKSLINIEAIIKYFIINNMASSFLLWSISYLFIIVETTNCFELQYLLISSLESIILENLYYVCFLLIISLFFKLALFPFQWWVADIYEGLWTPITLCYAVLIKITFFLFFFKLILTIFSSLIYLFQPFLLICALGSVIIGSLGALIQVKIKRFLAYTSIAQSGYIVMGISCNSLNGTISSFIYLFMYCLITLSFFCILLNMEHIAKGLNTIYLNQLYSLILYNKEITFHTIIILFVMAAIPPFSSFFAKFFIFIVTIEAKLEFITFWLLSFSLISTFYYLNFIQQLIFFKFNNIKIFKFNENILSIIFLRSNSFIFSFIFIFLNKLHNFSLSLLILALWPLTYN